MPAPNRTIPAFPLPKLHSGAAAILPFRFSTFFMANMNSSQMKPNFNLLPASAFFLACCIANAADAAEDFTGLSLESLMETTVTSASKYTQRQNETAAAVSVITRSQIKAFGWRTLDQALASLPGIHTTYDRQYTYLGTRGFGLPGDFNTRVLLAINGNRVNDAVYDQALMGREFPVDMDLVERIEFIAGPGGALYGQNAMFGVINVITRSGSQIDGGEFTTLTRNETDLNEGRISWGKALENGFDVMFSASAMRASGEDRFMTFPRAGESGEDISGIAYGLDGEEDKEFFTRVARGAWAFDFSYGDRSKDDPTGAFLGSPLVPGSYERDVNKLAQLRYENGFGDDTLTLTGRLFWGNERYTGVFLFPGTDYRSIGISEWYGTEFNVLYQGLANHKFLLGIELQDNARIDQVDEDLAALQPDRQILNDGYRAGLYAQHEWQLTDTLASTLGVRLDHNNITGSNTSPRAGLIWQASSTTTLKTLYGRAHRAPNGYEKDYQSNNHKTVQWQLPGETIDTFELLLDHQLSSELGLRGSVYKWNMQNILALVNDVETGLSQYQSGDEVEALGVELSARMSTGTGYNLTASVAHQDVSYSNGPELLNSPELLGKFNISAPLPWAKLLLAYELQYDAERLTRDGSDADDYWLSHLNLSTNQWISRVDLSLSVRNLFDQEYVHPAAETNWQNVLMQDGRSVQLRVDYRF
jgi:outer membrane receptor for ferrienterochelin and colicin